MTIAEIRVPPAIPGALARPMLSALVVARNEERQLADCLSCLGFADEIVVILDRCDDRSPEIARRVTDRVIEGAWEREGERRNTGIAACRGDWILEIDADERVGPELAAEIRAVVAHSLKDWHLIRVDNYIGDRLVRWGWGASFGRSAHAGLFRYGAKNGARGACIRRSRCRAARVRRSARRWRIT
jgi:glycosyltransferase involved in cell wall biosynthesis